MFVRPSETPAQVPRRVAVQQFVFPGGVTLATPGANAEQEATSEGDQVLAINGDYAQPVTVNGFACKNCTDVDYAKRFVDPAHPEAGPVNQDQPTAGAERGPSVVLGGGLAGGETGGSQADRDRALFRPYGPDARA